MININKLTAYELERRLDSLPENLAKLATSKTTEQAVELICADNNLRDPEKILAVKQVVALSILGFIHVYDLASEINSGAGLNNPPLSKDLASSIEAKIFAQFKAEVEKNYNPTPEENELESLTEDLGDFDVEEYEKNRPSLPVAQPGGGPSLAPRPLDSVAAMSSEKGGVFPAPTADTLPPTPKTNPFSFLGSPAAAAKPIEKIAEPIKPTPPAPQIAPQPLKSAPGPFVIHAENKEPQMVQAPKFKLESSGAPLSAFGLAGRATTMPQAPKPAQIEIGREEKLKPVEKFSKFESSPKAIHYSSLSSPITTEGAPKVGPSQQQAPFGNITPMAAPATGKPTSPIGGPAERSVLPSNGSTVPIKTSSIPAEIKSSLPQTPPVPKPASPMTIQTKNPLIQPAVTPPSFGSLVKNMVSPEKKGSLGTTTPPPAPTR